MTEGAAVQVRDLQMSYGSTQVLRGVGFVAWRFRWHS